VVASRLGNVTAEDVPTLAAAHNDWWSSYWNQSSIDLDEAHSDTEAFWWSAIYALGSASRAGQVRRGHPTCTLALK
jgi:alpha-L-fucosidase 2